MARTATRLGNLPAEVTSFIGRRRELGDLKQKLAEARLVTLLGPGGVGKTRLALRAAAELSRGFAAGAWLVDLSDLSEPRLVESALAAALDLRDQTGTAPRELVLSYLREKQLLMVLDNCEHLLGVVAPLASAMLRTTAGVRVIATSREPLSIPGEHVLSVPPLELPSAEGNEPLDRLRQNEAVRLFTERAAAAAGSFEVSVANRSSVAEVCRRLDGLPLAIELAAVRTRSLDVQEILKRLEDRFGLLTGGGRAALPRQQTLRTTIDWSYDLLSASERGLLRQLAVFSGGFSLEDVEGITASAELPRASLLDLLSSLVDKSLVNRDRARGEGWYDMHESMRAYAQLKLEEAGEADAVQERFDAYYTGKYRRVAPQARYQLVDWLARLDLEIDNVRAVLAHYLASGELARGLGLATSVGLYWTTRGTTEGTRWLDEFLSGGEGSPGAWLLRGALALLQADSKTARRALDLAMAAARDVGDAGLLSQSMAMASICANMTGDRPRAVQLLADAESQSAVREDVTTRLALLQARALDALFGGELDAVKAICEEGTQASREAGDVYTLGVLLTNGGVAALLTGDLEKSQQMFIEVLRIAAAIDDRVALHQSLGVISFDVARSGEPRRAAQLLGAAEAIRSEAHASVLPPLAPLLEQAQQLAIAGLDASRFRSEYAIGQGLGRAAAVALALGGASDAARFATGSAVLGKRETEVAQLIAEGMTNKQIGARLFISERTVEGHVRTIMNKLGFNSRAQIAAWTSAAET